MLQSLHIENYALIRETDISFHDGFVAITGETGAGKSILLGALGLLLGQRADTQVLADKEHKCAVEATFNISALSLQPLFEQYDADYDDTLILRREILPSGKSRAFVNDSPANLQFLKELGQHIIDIHSQYQTLTLTTSAFQIQLLDTFTTDSPLNNYQKSYQLYMSLKRELEQLTAEETQNGKVLDYNRFLFDELTAAALVNVLNIVDGIVVIGGGLSHNSKWILPGMMEEFNRPVGTFSGNLLPTLQSEVYNFEDPEQRAAFLEDKDVYVDVPHTDKKVLYCAQRKVAVCISELGASKAINLGAYNFALNQLEK